MAARSRAGSRARAGVLVGVLAVVLLLGACVAGGDGPASAARQAAGDPAAVAALSVDAPQPQAVMLEDGEVSDAEYESAIRAERDCVAAAGYEPDEVEWNAGELGFTTTATYEDEPDPEAADEAFTATIDECQREYSTLVATVWVAERE